VLGAGAVGHLGLHHLGHHSQAVAHAHGRQALTGQLGHIGERQLQLGRQRRPGRWPIVADSLQGRYGLHGVVVPFPCSVLWLDARHLPSRQVSGWGPPPHFNKLRDNLSRTTRWQSGQVRALCWSRVGYKDFSVLPRALPKRMCSAA